MHAGARSSWLEQAAQRRTCSLCAAASQFEECYLAAFEQELASPGPELAHFIAAKGFCIEHTVKIEPLLLADPQRLPEALRAYLEVFQAVSAELSGLEDDDWLEVRECPLCTKRDKHVADCARALMAALERHAGGTEMGGLDVVLCLDHFDLVWVSSEENFDRNQLRSIQLAAAAELTDQLRSTLADITRCSQPEHRPAFALLQRAAHSLSGWTAHRR